MGKITPFLWFENQAEEAVNFYTSIFKNSKILSESRYEKAGAEISGMQEGSIMTVSFELNGQKFTALNGGPVFKFTPAVSFTINLESEEEVDRLWEKLIDGGNAMMELGKYDWSEKYGWLQDKFGMSWQIGISNEVSLTNVIIPSLLFTGDNFGQAESALNFYTSMFKDSEICVLARYEKDDDNSGGKIKYSQCRLDGSNLIIMESGMDHKFSLNESISFVVNCEGQEEVDYFWNKFTEEGTESNCGWLKDKFGVSWQIVPVELFHALGNPDPAKAKKTMESMLKMKKIIIADL